MREIWGRFRGDVGDDADDVEQDGLLQVEPYRYSYPYPSPYP